MPLNFITGAPGSGKTSVTNEITARGLTIYDVDDPNQTGLAGWHNLATGEYVAGFNELELTEDLLATHVWRLTQQAVEDLRLRSERETIYLCGRLRDPKPVIDISESLLFLMVSGETIRRRLEARAQIPGEVEWGKKAWQIEHSVLVNPQIEEEYRKLGAIMIDAERPIVEVVDTIIDATVSS